LLVFWGCDIFVPTQSCVTCVSVPVAHLPPCHDAPACTADGNGITYNEHVNVALAVAMPDGGLITPVLKDADKVDIYQLSRNWADLVKRARSKQLQPDEYNSGTFTISNLGMFGVDTFDAILPPGEGLRELSELCVVLVAEA
jgi:hypothetical protein